MNKMSRTLGIAILLGLAAPFISQAGIPAARQTTLSGTVTKIYGNQITFKTTSAATYTAETSRAVLARKNGAGMRPDEIIVGDKIEARGLLWADNSMNASYVRNMSLYAHNGTFSGKIATIDPAGSSFSMHSRQYGLQNIRTDEFTVFKQNSANAALKELEPGFSVTVKGIWDRTRTNVAAKEVKATVRLINIDLTGTLAMRGDANSLTIAGDNNVLYGVDISKAKLLSKNNKPLSASQINMGDTLRVLGKHVSEGVKVTATQAKDLSVTK